MVAHAAHRKQLSICVGGERRRQKKEMSKQKIKGSKQARTMPRARWWQGGDAQPARDWLAALLDTQAAVHSLDLRARAATEAIGRKRDGGE
jgi:hypothetical protein